MGEYCLDHEGEPHRVQQIRRYGLGQLALLGAAAGLLAALVARGRPF